MKERGAIKCLHHTKKLREWDLTGASEYFISKVNCTGFQNLRESLEVLDRSLISAFVERWHSDTSTFHMPWGEMTITLDDVHQITGLTIEGEMYDCKKILDKDVCCDLVHNCLGIEKSDIKAEFERNKGGVALRMDWVKSHVQKYTSSSDENLVKYGVRGYLLYTLGCTLCPDKTGTKISPSYLQYVVDVDAISKVPFGMIGLAHLYKELNYACRGTSRQISGFLSMLEVRSCCSLC